MDLDLPLIWAGLIAFAVLAYVVLDGFDLGVGILFAAERGDAARDVMVNTVAPVWDGNETWLVLGGGGLFATFPLAYSVVLPALYPVIIAMLLALVFRGVAFEFRFRAESRAGREAWDLAILAGSTLAAFCQGLALGGMVQGIKVADRQYAGGWWDWLTGFSLLCGCAVVIGYALIVVVSLWTPMLNPAFAARWFGWPGILLASPVPLLLVVLARLFWRGLARRRDRAPFLCALGWFVLGYAGLGISLYPLIVPPSITIRQAAAPDESLLFLLVGAVVLLPVVLAYTGYAYWVFRGKVRAGEHYH